jgi:GMP synthase (glutamine-hydrolysing)
MIAKKSLVLVKTGDTLAEVKSKVGDFDQMFLDQLGESGAAVEVTEVHKGGRLPALSEVDAVIVTGSPSSVTAREPWAEELATWLRDAVGRDKHVLGVCYGHQLLAYAIGGTVEKNPRGYEIGTISVELTEDGKKDVLLGPIARGEPVIDFQSTHMDAVMSLPSGARILASTQQTPVQAFLLGERAWGVQFHPEMTGETIRLYVEGRTPQIAADAERRGLDPSREVSRVKTGVRETPAGPALLRRFISLVEGAKR